MTPKEFPNYDRTAAIDAACDMIQLSEGFREKPYQCSADVWTIGFGTTRYANGIKVREKDPSINKQHAQFFLQLHILKLHDQLWKALKKPVKTHQCAALISLIYNIGIGNFTRSTLLKKLNEGLYDEAYLQFGRWIKAGGKVNQGLVNRRIREMTLFILD